MLLVLIFLAIMLSLSDIVNYFHNRHERFKKAKNHLSVVCGEVTEVSSIWSGNGDGGITIVDSHKKKTNISIVGSTDRFEETAIRLHSVKYVQDLVGKEVDIVLQSKDKAILIREK